MPQKYYYLIFALIYFSAGLLVWKGKKVKFAKYLDAYFYSSFIVGLIFIYFNRNMLTNNGWFYNDQFLAGISLMNLPLEEILFLISFFFTASITFEIIRISFPERKIILPKRPLIILALFFMLPAVIHMNKSYTFAVTILTSLSIMVATFLFNEQHLKRSFWISVVAFYPILIAADLFKCGLPIVQYNADAIIGSKVLSVPIENFLYSFVMVFLYFTLYSYFRGKSRLK